jgi:hypothetical protein
MSFGLAVCTEKNIRIFKNCREADLPALFPVRAILVTRCVFSFGDVVVSRERLPWDSRAGLKYVDLVNVDCHP